MLHLIISYFSGFYSYSYLLRAFYLFIFFTFVRVSVLFLLFIGNTLLQIAFPWIINSLKYYCFWIRIIPMPLSSSIGGLGDGPVVGGSSSTKGGRRWANSTSNSPPTNAKLASGCTHYSSGLRTLSTLFSFSFFLIPHWTFSALVDSSSRDTDDPSGCFVCCSDHRELDPDERCRRPPM